jgi:hypothetical protein
VYFVLAAKEALRDQVYGSRKTHWSAMIAMQARKLCRSAEGKKKKEQSTMLFMSRSGK